jgi:hypothetical protein
MTTLSDIAKAERVLDAIKRMPAKDWIIQHTYVLAQRQYDDAVTMAIKEGVL